MSIRERLADHFILRATTHWIEAVGLRRIAVPYGAGVLESFVARIESGRQVDSEELSDAMPPPRLLVIRLPGTGGRAERSTSFPASLVSVDPSEVWTWNPPGYGRSSGRATLKIFAHAVLEFYDYVVTHRRGPETRVWICGNSLGCATALYLASQRPAAGLVLRNPPPLVDLVRQRDAWWNIGIGGQFVAGGIPPEMDALSTAGRVTIPAVFIESGADTLVTTALQELVRNAYAGPQRRLLMPGASHGAPIGDEHREELIDVLEWLWRASGE